MKELNELLAEVVGLDGWKKRIRNLFEEQKAKYAKDLAELSKENERLKGKKCKWKYFESDDAYTTSCGQVYCLEDGDLKDNHYKYCMHCGGKIEELLKGE